MQGLVHRLATEIGALEAVTGACDGLGPIVGRLRPLLQELSDVASLRDRESALHEALKEQYSAQRELLLALGCPILQVRTDMLCVPLLGNYDIDRATQLRDAVLAAISAMRARLLVLDLTGALVPEPAAAEHLLSICRAVRLLGVRPALSGISAPLAAMLATANSPLHDVPVYLSLAAAIEATRS